MTNKMTFGEACDWIARNKPFHWNPNELSSEERETQFARDRSEAFRMSDPATWPKASDTPELPKES